MSIGKQIVDAALTRKGKNIYSQDMNKRYMIENGYGDCSATVRHWIKKITGKDIGLNTEAQIKSKLGRIIEMKIINGIPDESKMQLGDCLYFRGKNDVRYLGTGHVEMYIGNGQCFGHGSGIGGTIKNMKAYCAKRQATKSTAKLKNTGLIAVVRFIEDEKVEPVKSINVKKVNPYKQPTTTVKIDAENSEDDVAWVQWELINSGINSIVLDGKVKKVKIDGDFGKITEEAVKVFQRKYKLDDDGKVGSITRNTFIKY
jgi:cell wall-associated NlpC family hydrolase